MHIYLAHIGGPLDAPVDRLEHLASLDRYGSHAVVKHPDDADVILYSQCHMLHRDWRLSTVAAHAEPLFNSRTGVGVRRARPTLVPVSRCVRQHARKVSR